MVWGCLLGIPAQSWYLQDLGAWNSISLTWTGLQVQQLTIILHTVLSVGLRGTDNLCSWAWPGGTVGITRMFVQEEKREK